MSDPFLERVGARGAVLAAMRPRGMRWAMVKLRTGQEVVGGKVSGQVTSERRVVLDGPSITRFTR